ncbi:MAG: hypothetical protein ACXVAY_00195 [Mucilaginibacter sp.]
MKIPDQQRQYKQVQFIFWMNLAMTLFAFTAFMKSFDSKQTWRVVCSGAGFALLLLLTIAILLRLLRMKKEKNL